MPDSITDQFMRILWLQIPQPRLLCHFDVEHFQCDVIVIVIPQLRRERQAKFIIVLVVLNVNLSIEYKV